MINVLHNVIFQSTAYLLWFLTTVSNLAIIYGNYGHFISPTEPSALSGAMYNALAGTVWSIGLGWLTYACIIGYGGDKLSIEKKDDYFMSHLKSKTFDNGNRFCRWHFQVLSTPF